MRKDTILMTVQRSSGFISTMLRTLLLFMMMTVGVNSVWGQTDYSGVYYIANDNGGKDGTGTGSGSSDITPYSSAGDNKKWYLVPADNPQQRLGNSSANFTDYRDAWYSPDHASEPGNSEQPFLTTYQTNKDVATVPSGVTSRANNSLWIVKKTGSNYYVIHAATGKYVIYEVPLPNDPNTNSNSDQTKNGKRKTMHLQTPEEGTYSLNTNNNFQFTITKDNNNIYRLQPINRSGWYWNPANGNQNKYYGINKNIFQGGLVGVYNNQDDGGSKWHFEDATFAAPTISVNGTGTAGTFSISATYVPTGCEIRYTTGDGTQDAPTATTGSVYSTSPDTPVTIDGFTNVKAAIVGYGMVLSEIADVPVKCATPTIDYDPGTHTVTLACATTGSTIHYKIGDGDYTEYNGPFNNVVNGNVIYAYATMANCLDSEPIDPYTVLDVCATPSIVVTYNDGTATVTITNNEDGATVHYTTDGSEPDGDSPSTPLTFNVTSADITSGMTVRAIAMKAGYNNSNTAEETVNQVAMPVIEIVNNEITISCATDGATIYYTVDGSAATEYTSALGFDASGKAITAYATKTGMVTSATAEADENATKLQLAAPVITYDPETNKVVITSTSGTTIKYVTGETESSTGEPTTEYSTGFDLPDYHHVIKAIAETSTAESSEVAIRTIAVQTTTDDNHPRPYLIQSVECTDFYVLPGDVVKNVIYLNTSSLGRASMEWCFYYAGTEGGVDYYIIKNKNHTTNPYLRSNTNWISLQTANTYTSASEADKKEYWFSIVYENTASNPGYYIHPYNATAGNGLSKKGGNNTADALELADATIDANSFARWNFIPSAKKPEATPPFKAWGEGGQYKYYKIKKDNSNFIIPPTKTGAYATVSNVSDPNNSMLWYFDKDDASSDEWVSYYHIVNAATGEYLYFNGNETSANDNAFIMKGDFVTTEADRYLFAFAKTTTEPQYYILPKILQDITKNNYSLVFDNGANPLITKATRADAKGKWTFEESDVSLICVPPVISLATDGNVTLSPRTIGAAVKYTVGNDPQKAFDNSSNPITTLSERDVVEIVTETTLGETSTVKTVTVIYKPTIEFDPNQSIVYNGRTHAPELSSVNGSTEPISHCVVTSGDINAGLANAVITQKEDETEYVIYGTKEFTIERSPLTIAADDQTMEYGEQAPTEWTYKTSGLAYIDDVTVQLECTPGESLGSYPITFSNLVNKTGKLEIKRNNSDVSSYYTDITLIPSFLYVVPKSIGNGILPAEHISISLTENTPLVTFTKTGGEITLTEDVDYTYGDPAENSRKEVIWTISGKGNYGGAAQVACIKPTFVGNGGTANPTEYIAAFNGSLDWTPTPAEWNPTGGSKKIWMVTSVNPTVGVVRVKPVTYLPKDMPVLLTSGVNEPTGINALPKSNETESVSDSERDNNLLKVVPENKENPTQGKHVKTAEVYVFHNKPSGGTGEFVLALEGWLPSGKFYIDNPNYSSTGSTNNNAPTYLHISWDESTAIPEVHNDVTIERGDAYWYSIDGRRLKGKPTAKGLYIVNGKKVIVK